MPLPRLSPRARIGPGHWWLISALVLLVGLPAAGVVVAISVIHPNDYKARITEAVTEAIGRTLKIDGPLRISWSLSPTLSVTGVKLANLRDGSRPDMASVERVSARISLLPLLWHRLDITQLALTGPNILFEPVGDTPNWVFDAEMHTTGSARSSPFKLHIRNVQVTNGMVTFRFPARTKVIGIRSLAFHHATLGGQLDLAAVLVYSDYKPFTLQARATPAGGTSGPWKTRLDLAAFGATVSARGTMDLVGGYDLRINAKVPKLEALNALLPQMHLPALHGVTLATRIGNGPVRGDLPVVCTGALHFDSADLGGSIPGLMLGLFDISLPEAGGLASIDGAARYAGRPVTITGTVGVPKYPDRMARLPIDLQLHTGSASDHVALDGTLSLRDLAFDGLDTAISLQAAALAAFRPQVSPLLPALTSVMLHAQLAVPADAAAFVLTKATLQSAEADAAGTLKIKPGAVAALDANLHATRIDLDALLPAGTAKPAAGAHAGAAGGVAPVIPTAPLPWALLRGPAIDFTGQADAVTYRKRRWTDLAVSIQLKDGSLHVDRLRLTPPGGAPIDGSASADAAARPVAVTLALHGKAIPLTLIAAEAGLLGPFTGRAALDMTLGASGGSLHELAASLTGPVSITLVGGSISAAALGSLAGDSLHALGIRMPASQGETPIRCFGLIGSFKAGIGRFPIIALDIGVIDLSGQGQMDLGSETIALKLHPLARVSGAPVKVPVLVEGPLNDMHGKLDASGIDKVGLLIDAWFGGDHPKTCADAGLTPVKSH